MILLIDEGQKWVGDNCGSALFEKDKKLQAATQKNEVFGDNLGSKNVAKQWIDEQELLIQPPSKMNLDNSL